MLKKAMIMAAGVGSRLGTLSDITPKPLVPLVNIPAMDILLKHLSLSGINDVIANTFYKAEDIQNRYISNRFNINFNYIQEKELSGTAGGMKKCQFFFEDVDDFIVMSGDGLCDIDIQAAYNSHKNANTIATIVTNKVQCNEVSKYGIIVTDGNGIIESFQEKPPVNEAKSNLANTGIYIFKREIFDFIPENTIYDFAKNLFPFLMQKEIKINTYNHRGYWSDIGSIEQYKQSNRDILDNLVSSLKVNYIQTNEGKFVQGENNTIPSSVRFIGNSVIGNNCIIGENCIIENSVLWDNIKVEDNIEINNSIILNNAVIKNAVKDCIIAEKAAAFSI